MEHLYEFWDFFKRVKKNLIPDKYEIGDFMFDLYEIMKENLRECKVTLHKYGEDGHRVFETIDVNKTVFFIGHKDLNKNTKFIIKNIEGDYCYAWCPENKRLYHLPLTAFSETPFKTISHFDIDPLGEDDWDDDIPQRGNIKYLHFEIYDYVIKVNDIVYITCQKRYITNDCYLNIKNKIGYTNKEDLKNINDEFDDFLKTVIKNHSYHSQELSYKNYYTIENEKFRTIIKLLKYKV